MRISWILVLSATFAFVLPFLVIYLPYALFSMYMHDLRTASSSIHIQASMHSVFESATAMLCLVPPVSALAFVCPSIPESKRDSALMLQQVSGAQQAFLDQLTRYAPTPEVFAIVSSIQRAAHFAFVFDGTIALQSGHPQGPEGNRAGGMLSDIHHLSRELLVSLREVGLHVEVAIARVASIQSSVVTGLVVLHNARVYSDHRLRTNPPRFDRIVALFANASSDSAQHVLQEVQRAMSISSNLSSTLDHFRRTAEPARSCAPVSKPLCDTISPLFFRHTPLSSVSDRLALLQVTLQEELDESSREIATPPALTMYPVQAVRAILEAQLRVYRKQLLVLRRTRRFLESGKFGAK
ncbi:hypothetical protein TRAPUB_13836 [Trametes pubescens]|uniref:Transmembrane protein n=1 Tax=Trametes pubescens TaxID=154538 RepID=A0A1M2VQ18_TRAPU|nr:hypothetical protein TRAPUB_13836 [Trametes pubescens]